MLIKCWFMDYAVTSPTCTLDPEDISAGGCLAGGWRAAMGDRRRAMGRACGLALSGRCSRRPRDRGSYRELTIAAPFGGVRGEGGGWRAVGGRLVRLGVGRGSVGGYSWVTLGPSMWDAAPGSGWASAALAD